MKKFNELMNKNPVLHWRADKLELKWKNISMWVIYQKLILH